MSRAALLAVVGALGGCVGLPVEPPGTACTDLFAFGLTVVVRDADTGEALCDATVRAIDGDFEETLDLVGEGATCSFVGAGERPGTYAVEARKPGYETRTIEGVVVPLDAQGCHVEGQQVDVELVAAP